MNNILYGSVDEQKYETVTPTAKSHHSRKHYKKLGLCYLYITIHLIQGKNNWSVRGEHKIISFFDLWYNNISLIQSTVLTGDMHSINKANSLFFISLAIQSSFTNIKKEIQNIFCPKDLSRYKDFLALPARQINRDIPLDEKEHIKQIIASLGPKEMSQSTLIKKVIFLVPIQ